jgi:FkbM family methyltransferase
MLWRRLRLLGLRGCGLVVLHRLTGRVSLGRFQIAGLPHPVHLRIGTHDFRDFWRTFEEGDIDFDLGNPRVIVDAGAGSGVSAVWFAVRYPMATVYAVEMERANFAVLDLNTAPYLNIVPARAAIAGHVGKLIIAEPGKGHWGFQLTDGPEGQAVTGITVGRLLDHYNCDHADVVKLSIDDALTEEVIEDAPNWLHRVDSLVIEDQAEMAADAILARFPVRQRLGRQRFYSRF